MKSGVRGVRGSRAKLAELPVRYCEMLTLYGNRSVGKNKTSITGLQVEILKWLIIFYAVLVYENMIHRHREKNSFNQSNHE
jgi:hypothetical protein